MSLCVCCVCACTQALSSGLCTTRQGIFAGARVHAYASPEGREIPMSRGHHFAHPASLLRAGWRRVDGHPRNKTFWKTPRPQLAMTSAVCSMKAMASW